MKKIIVLMLALILLTGCGNKYTVIDTNTAKSKIEEGAILIDVRTEEEYAESHIENAINIPLDIIETIDLNKDDVIVLYCASGMRSVEAAKKLVAIGYTNIYSLDGGLINWG